MAEPKDLYAESGVDTSEADEGLQRLIRRIKATWPAAGAPGAVQLDIGYFANVITVGGTGLAICTDGIGSKAIIAQMMDRYDTVGIDCVAMNVNDLICVGARPLSMVDYIAVERAHPALLEALSVGLAEGAKQAGVSISGGEISQIKDIIKGHRPGWGFDLVGMAVGDVALDRINTGRHVRAGDLVIGIESNGIHSNGLTLARRAFFDEAKLGIDHRFAELDRSLGEELLRPTHIYVREVLDLIATVPGVNAMVHITGDGLLNLLRVEAPVGFAIDAMPPPPPIFPLIQRHGGVDDAEMYQVYNMGVGFCVVVAPGSADAALALLKKHGRRASIIGRAVDDPEKKIRMNRNLEGRGKRFYRV
jgi:phosphoribosylformylglycinamidine cyclo-ligase